MMRILHVVTLVTPDMAFGGPTRVAVNHVRELSKRGHEAILVAGAKGYDGELPTSLEGVPAKLFHARQVLPLGVSGLIAPGMFRWIRDQLPTVDVLHAHLTRDLVVLPVTDMARRKGVPYVVQTHGMVDRSRRILAHLLDRAILRRVLREADSVYYLSSRELTDLSVVLPDRVTVRELVNGTPMVPAAPLPDRATFLFLGRLHEEKRPTAFVEAARLLLTWGVDASFVIAGPDGGELAAVEAAISAADLEARVRYVGSIPPDKTGERLAESTCLVMPSIKETFPMSALEAMARGRPVVVTRTCGLAEAVDAHGAGLVVEPDPESIARGLYVFAKDREALLWASTAAKALVDSRYSMSSVIDSWEEDQRWKRACKPESV